MLKEARYGLIFVVMCTVWGLAWIAVRIGVQHVPPFSFAAARFVVAGLVLALIAKICRQSFKMRHALWRVAYTSSLIVTTGYATTFWGAQYVSSGVAAILNMSLTPILLFVFGLVLKEERYSAWRVGGIAIGVLGLFILFYPKIVLRLEPLTLAGMGALVLGTVSINLGYVLTRRLVFDIEPLSLAAMQTFIGGVGLAALALLTESKGYHDVQSFASSKVFASWLFLVIGASVIGFTSYLTLLRKWGPSKAGLYAFISPVIAVVVGVSVFNESLGAYECVGAALMLTATKLAMHDKNKSVESEEDRRVG